MKTVKPNFDQYAIDSLKIKLSEKIGYVVANKPDCLKLSEIIAQNGNGYLSETTLYRLFFQPDKHSPYKNTLDILCQFLGFKDCFDFLESIKSTKELLHLNGISTTYNSCNTLLFYCIQNITYQPLTDFFDAINQMPHQFKTSVSIALFDSLQKVNNPNLFFNHFAQSKYIREYFFEKGHDPKFRIKNYDSAYQKYLIEVDKNADISQFQDYIFGNCVLFRYYFLNKKYTEALNLGNQIYNQIKTLEHHQNDLYIFPYIRFTAYKLWYLQMTNASKNQMEDYGYYLLDLCKKIKPNFAYTEQKILFHTIAETFLYSTLSETFHWDLKKIYACEFDKFPNIVFSKHLKYSLPYFEENGLLHHRP